MNKLRETIEYVRDHAQTMSPELISKCMEDALVELDRKGTPQAEDNMRIIVRSRILEEKRKYEGSDHIDWAEVAASKVIATIREMQEPELNKLRLETTKITMEEFEQLMEDGNRPMVVPDQQDPQVVPIDKAVNLHVGQRVKVTRQIGKNGTPEEVTGAIERFSSIIFIGGEPTAIIAYDDGEEAYCHPLSGITPIEP